MSNPWPPSTAKSKSRIGRDGLAPYSTCSNASTNAIHIPMNYSTSVITSWPEKPMITPDNVITIRTEDYRPGPQPEGAGKGDEGKEEGRSCPTRAGKVGAGRSGWSSAGIGRCSWMERCASFLRHCTDAPCDRFESFVQEQRRGPRAAVSRAGREYRGSVSSGEGNFASGPRPDRIL